MSADAPERAERAFATHDAFEREGEAFVVTTTRFGGQAAVAEADEEGAGGEYTLTVRAPMLHAAVEGTVGEAVESGWFETFERRLGDAAMATRADVDLVDLEVAEEGEDAVVTFTLSYGTPSHAPDVVKAIAEFVEGTYVEGVIPGYDYRGVVADLLGEADTGGQGTGTPLEQDC